MKLAIIQIKLDLARSSIVDHDLNDPAKPLHLSVGYDAPSPLLLRDKRPAPAPFPILTLQVDPSAPVRRHRYIALTTNLQVDTGDLGVERLDYVGTVINPNDGQLLALFEVPSEYIATMDAAAARAKAAIAQAEHATVGA